MLSVELGKLGCRWFLGYVVLFEDFVVLLEGQSFSAVSVLFVGSCLGFERWC